MAKFSNNLGVSAPDVPGVFGNPNDGKAGGKVSGSPRPRGRGKTATATSRPPNQIDVMTANQTPNSNQEQFTGRGRIVPTPLQPRNLSKRIENLKLPANFSK